MIQPNEIQWGKSLQMLLCVHLLNTVSVSEGLMIASTYKRGEDVEMAYKVYERLHDDSPSHVECEYCHASYLLVL